MCLIGYSFKYGSSFKKGITFKKVYQSNSFLKLRMVWNIIIGKPVMYKIHLDKNDKEVFNTDKNLRAIIVDCMLIGNSKIKYKKR